MSLQHINTGEFEFGEVGRTMPSVDISLPLTHMALGLHYLARAVGEITVKVDANNAMLVSMQHSSGRGPLGT